MQESEGLEPQTAPPSVLSEPWFRREKAETAAYLWAVQQSSPPKREQSDGEAHQHHQQFKSVSKLTRSLLTVQQ